MAGHVFKRHLKLPEVDKQLLDGCVLWRWEEGDSTPQKLTFKVDKEGFFLYARGEDENKVYDNYVWDLQLVSDVRGGKSPKDSRLSDALHTITGSDVLDRFSLTLVYRRDGIVNLDMINLICEWPKTADQFKLAVNALTYNMLHANAAPVVLYRKNYVKIILHANSHGQIPLKHINRLMMNRQNAAQYINLFLTGFNIVATGEDGQKYVLVQNFTWDIFNRMVDQLLNNRTEQLDLVLPALCSTKKVMIQKVKVELNDFQQFLNSTQRDPRLNEILHPPVPKKQAKDLLRKLEDGKDRLTARGVLDYLMSEDNNVLELSSLDQHMDMNQPLNHYFVNSSHNTYLNGHQLKSQSLSEMYIQALLKGCRCLELDCWPTGGGETEDICITHGGTWCTKVSFKEVVEAINEFAFVNSDYPVVLSIENHCKPKPHLIQKMANIFTTTFGDKLMKEPFEDLPLESGKPLPSVERLKGKILLKDKVKRKKEVDEGTLKRNTHMPASLAEIPEGSEESNGETGKPLNNKAMCKESFDSGEDSDKKEEGGGGGEEEGDKANNSGVEGAKKEEENAVDGEDADKEGKGEGGGTRGEGGAAAEEKEENKTEAGGKEEGKEEAKERTKEETKEETKEGGAATAADVSTHEKVKRKGSEDVFLSGTKKDDLPGMEEMMQPSKYQETEAMVSGPLKELLNYTTGIRFEGFAAAEKLNCSFYMCSFVEDKGQVFIKTQAREFLKYNQRQMSRVYPQGTRINSSNYMPQIFWNVGCQFVALNYQTSDLPIQLNLAKFEVNGGTGYILKPWVMMRESMGGGVLNTFTQSKLEDIVPARVSIKIISGSFLTEKRTNCIVEAEMYGLPADTVRHKYTKKAAAPHPFWDEEPFTFKRILLPELALLRLAVFDDDRELIGQRCLPVNHIRPGFRYIPLRDKHNQPLSLAMLFVKITVEDWVPNEFEDVVAMLMDPVSFAQKALEELAKGDEFDEVGGVGEGETFQDGAMATPATPIFKTPPSGSASGVISAPQANPGRSNVSGTSNDQLLVASSSDSRPFNTLPKTATMSDFPDSLPCYDKACSRPQQDAIKYDSKIVMDQAEYSKLIRRLTKQRSSIVKGQEKSLKQVQGKLQKMKSFDLGSPKELDAVKQKLRDEISTFDSKALEERHTTHRRCLEMAHAVQMKNLEKIYKSDIDSMHKELASLIKTHSKSVQVSDKKQKEVAAKEVEEKAVKLGKTLRVDFAKLHGNEKSKLEENQTRERQLLLEEQAKEKVASGDLQSLAEEEAAAAKPTAI